jgi:CRP-like cAMP-binding protein
MGKSTPDRRGNFPAAPPWEPNLLLGLTRQQKDRVLKAAKTNNVRAKQTIVREEEPARRLFLVKKGRIKYVRETSKGEEVLISLLTPGYIFGVGAVIAWPERYIGTAHAAVDSELLSWNRETIRALTSAYPHLSQNVLRITLKAVAEYVERVVRLKTGTARERLAYALVRVCKRIGQVRQDGVAVTILNEELAGLADVSPFTVSRQLKEWERQGIVRKGRGQILVVAPGSLLTG